MKINIKAALCTLAVFTILGLLFLLAAMNIDIFLLLIAAGICAVLTHAVYCLFKDFV